MNMQVSDSKQIAQTILAQLGAGRFIAMTGSKNFLAMGDGLRFDLTRNQSGANRCHITLHADDTYEVLFYKLNKTALARSPLRPAVKNVAQFEGIYCDQLQDIFTSVTGLDTSLGTAHS